VVAIRRAHGYALAYETRNVATEGARLADYSHVPLARKLGIQSGALVLTVAPPARFLATLEPLPECVELVRRPPRARLVDVLILFCARRADLARSLDAAAAVLAPAGGLWVAWPKRSSRLATDLDFDAVQSAGLRLGLVDNKSCSMSEDHSGLRFVVRREHRAAWARTHLVPPAR